MTVAKHADPTFDEHVMRYPREAREQLEKFGELGELDQAALVLHLAQYVPRTLALAFRTVNELPCWENGCGHPRHVGGCQADEDCECYR